MNAEGDIPGGVGDGADAQGSAQSQDAGQGAEHKSEDVTGPKPPPFGLPVLPAPMEVGGDGLEAHATGDPWAHRRGEPRTFAAIWLLFLFAATILSVGAVGVFGLVSTDVYRPAARIMLEGVTVGVVILWPMVRLSQQAPDRPFKAMALDALVVLGPAQAVIWPQALSWMAGWPLEVVGMAAGLLTGWGVLVAGLLAFYFGKCGVPSPDSRVREQAFVPRWAMMALIVLLVGIGPVVVALSPQISGAGPSVDWLMTSPLTGIYEVTRDRPWTGQSAAIDERHRMAVWIVWLAAAGVWGVAWAAGGRDKDGGVATGE